MSRIGRIIALVVVTTFLAVVKIERTFVAQCIVNVTDTLGRPIHGARVSQGWNAYSYDLSGGDDRWTNEFGLVVFPPRTARHSLLYWCLVPVATHLNFGAHASSGISAFVNVSSSPNSSGAPSSSGAFSCRNDDCNQHLLTFTLVVESPR